MKNKKDISPLEWTGERYIPEIKGGIALEHLHRYAMACQFAKGKNVLDIASGEGYGSEMLAKVANHVIGVDISEEAISFAAGKYSRDNLEFKVGSCAEIPLKDASLDLIVSFETIEHHDQHEAMLKEFKRILHPNGVLIISSPDKYEYSDMPNYSNPFHVKELYRNEFESLVSKYFENMQIYGQRVIYGSGIFIEKGPASYVNFSEDGEVIDINDGLFRPVYNIVVASNTDLQKAVSGVFELPVWQSDVAKSLVRERDQAVEQSNIAMAERTETINRLTAKLAEQDETVNGITAKLAERDEAIRGLTTQLSVRDEEVNGLTAKLAERDEAIRGLTTQLSERDEEVNGLTTQLAEQTETIRGLTTQLSVRDEEVNGLTTQLAERDEAIRGLTTQLAERTETINGLTAKLAERDKAINGLTTQIAEQEETIKRLSTQLSQRDEAVHGLTSELVETQTLLQRSKDEMDLIYNSKSWKLTKPLRSVRRIFSVIYLRIRQYSSNIARAIWHGLPLPVKIKLVFMNIIFKTFPFLFKHTFTYRVWHAAEPYHELNSGTVFIDQGEQASPVSLLDADPLAEVPVRLIAFYLPQFHPIPENDEWWGKGFTEWTNVKRSYPQFSGHYQPHVPGELGYYDLRCSEIQKRQVELAKLYGIGGFCFHFYWFAGKRLLELPVQQYVDDSNLDLPFCLCWANENWTRRWDGLDSDILISQDHSPEDDLAFIGYVSRYLRDPRYIRIQGKPLLIVYRPILLPSAKKTAKRWRIWCRENDIGEIYLAYTQSFESVNPRKYGFDGAIEFPPNNTAPPVITSQVKPKDSDFSGVVYDWNIFVERSQKYQKPDYPLFRGVCPAWDNTARCMENAGIFLGSTPEKYGEWLENASIDTVRRFSDPSERLVFVNAWNEWAEGAYLEPEQKYGYAYLQSTRDALERVNNTLGKRRILLVAHDAHRMGAQYLALHMVKMLAEDLKFAVDMVVLGGGPLLKDYGRYATLHLLYGRDARNKNAKALAAELFAEGVRSAIANTSVTGLFVQILKEQGFHVVSLIHELPGIIKKYKLQSHVKSIAEYADSVVFPAKKVLEGFKGFSKVSSQQAVIRPQGLYRKNLIRNKEQIEEARKHLRSQLGLPENAQIVLCVGLGDHRKGIDLFIDIGMKVIEQMPNTYFLWVGRVGSDIMRAVASSRFQHHYIFTGHKSQVDIYYAGSDVFALTSREDPFPTTVMEALYVKVPVVAFDEAGGFTELLSRGGGQLVPAYDIEAFARCVMDLLSHPEKAHALGVAGCKIVECELSFRHYVFDLLKLAKAPKNCVSVIVPNYNYANYLLERIKTIVDQEYPIYEIIILDDDSTDDSVPVINKIISTLNIDCRLIVNESNSGNPFAQWLKGVELAQGDYIWIAEADDLSESGFLGEVLKSFKDPSVVMSYCQSKQMDSECKILCDDYLDYVSDVSSEKWSECYVENGLDEIRTCLAIKNTIPNVSAVVFERNALLHVLKENIKEIKEYFVAGDWLTYIFILNKGKIAFSPKAYNLHRRHQHSVTISNFNLSQLEEILTVQQKVRNNYRPDEEVITKAKAYSQRLYKDFNLSTRDAPVIAKHLQLSMYLDD